MPTRDEIRSAFLGQKPKTLVVNIAGVDMELRQPPIGAILTSSAEEGNTRALAVQMLTNYCFVPGTGEAVFDEADAEAIMSVPFNADYQKLQEAINELADVTSMVDNAGKNSSATPAQS